MRTAGRPSIVGHRGAMGTRPENTIVAFERAAELGAEWIELDTRLAKDGVPVVIHDPTLERTTNGKGAVASRTSKQIGAVAAGTGAFEHARVPTLEDTLAWAKERGVRVQIELKGDPAVDPALAEAVAACVKRTTTRDEVLVISFDHRATAAVKGLVRVRTGLLYAARPADPVRLAKTSRADVLVPHCSFVTAEDVAALHGAGLAIATWAPSEPKMLAALVALGVDAVTVDHPDVLAKVLRKRR